MPLYTNQQYNKAQTDEIYSVMAFVEGVPHILCHRNKTLFLVSIVEVEKKHEGNKEQIDKYFDKFAVFFTNKNDAERQGKHMAERGLAYKVVKVGIKGDGLLGVSHGLPHNE